MTLNKKTLLIIIVAVALIILAGCSGITNQTTPQQETQGSKEDSSQKASPAQDNSFIFPESSTKKLTEDELRKLDLKKLALARNEIFARRGYVFTEVEYKAYFSQKKWYKPDNNFKADDLNSTERYNVNLIRFFEDKIANDSKLYGERPQLSNVYQLGQEVTLDLNGDGINEKIRCQKESGKVRLTINNSFLEIDSKNPADMFAIVDLDKADKYREIALSDYGPSDDPTSVFCYYDGKNVINMGKTEGLYNIGNKLDGSINIDGSGIMTVKTRSRILQTWFYSKKFDLLTNHRLEETALALYPTDYDVFVIQPFKLYLNKNDTSPSIPVNDGQTLKLIGTDEQAWCLAETTTGVKGWIAVDKYDTLRNNGRKALETFAGLTYAD